MSQSEDILNITDTGAATSNKEDNLKEMISNNNDSFNKLFSLQKLVLKEAGLKELCNKYIK